jgi:hypothetical protein
MGFVSFLAKDDHRPKDEKVRAGASAKAEQNSSD